MKARRPSTVIGHLFSRGVLGSMLVGTGVGKMVEKAVIIIFPASPYARLAGWTAATVVFITLYVYWADFEDYVNDAADTVDAATGGDSGDD